MSTNEISAEKLSATLAVLERAASYQGVALASSLSAEDMVLTDLIARHALPIDIFAIDTGMLHTQTIQMIATAKHHYGREIQVFRPQPQAVEAYRAQHGTYGFYESLDLRHSCCAIRKIEPLNRALVGRSAWITGQRQEQSPLRTSLQLEEQDQTRHLQKFNPLACWLWEDVLDYVSTYQVPLNPLHAKGYPSIGCEPCTRAIRPGEDARAGRWWWENSESKECGLHVNPPHASNMIQEELAQ